MPASLLELLHLPHQGLVERHRGAAALSFANHPAHHVVDLGRALAHREVAPGAGAHLDLAARLVGEAVQHGARLALLGRRAGPQLQRLEGAEALELHAGRKRRADALADEGRQNRLITRIAERVGEGLIADRLGEKQRAVDLLRPEIAGDVVRDVCLDRMGKELLDAREALRNAAVELADPDVAEAALLDVAGALPVGREADESADHARLAEALRDGRRVHTVLQRDHHRVRTGERRERVERGVRVLRLHGEKNETQASFQVFGQDRFRRDLQRFRAADAQPGRIHCVDVVGRLVDEQHVLAGLRHEGAHDAADG